MSLKKIGNRLVGRSINGGIDSILIMDIGTINDFGGGRVNIRDRLNPHYILVHFTDTSWEEIHKLANICEKD